MTPKEKAKELVEKYKPFVYCYLGSGMLMNWEDKDVILSNAKKCALIAVDEILNARETVNVHINQHCESNLFDFMQYWQQVKQEIKNYEPNI